MERKPVDVLGAAWHNGRPVQRFVRSRIVGIAMVGLEVCRDDMHLRSQTRERSRQVALDVAHVLCKSLTQNCYSHA